MRNIGSLNISLGLVNIPLKINSFLDYSSISFKQLCPEHKTPISQKKVCVSCNKEIPYGSLLSGYPISKSEMVVVDKTLFEVMENRTRILAVISPNAIPEYLPKKAYLLSPFEEHNHKKAYFLLRELLLKSDTALVIHYTFRKSMKIGVIKPIMIKGYCYLMLKEILYHDKIKDISILDEIPIKKEEFELAKELFETILANLKKVDFTQLKDERKQLLEKYLKGEIKAVEIPQAKEVSNLIEQFKNSIELEKNKEKKKIKKKVSAK